MLLFIDSKVPRFGVVFSFPETNVRSIGHYTSLICDCSRVLVISVASKQGLVNTFAF